MFCKCFNCGCTIHLTLVDKSAEIDKSKQPNPEDIYCYSCWKEKNANDAIRQEN